MGSFLCSLSLKTSYNMHLAALGEGFLSRQSLEADSQFKYRSCWVVFGSLPCNKSNILLALWLHQLWSSHCYTAPQTESQASKDDRTSSFFWSRSHLSDELKVRCERLVDKSLLTKLWSDLLYLTVPPLLKDLRSKERLAVASYKGRPSRGSFLTSFK